MAVVGLSSVFFEDFGSIPFSFKGSRKPRCVKVCDLGHYQGCGKVGFCTAAFLYSSEPSKKLLHFLGASGASSFNRLQGKLGLAKLLPQGGNIPVTPIGWKGMSLAPLHDAAFPSPFVP